jgi:hypothetical protein
VSNFQVKLTHPPKKISGADYEHLPVSTTVVNPKHHRAGPKCPGEAKVHRESVPISTKESTQSQTRLANSAVQVQLEIHKSIFCPRCRQLRYCITVGWIPQWFHRSSSSTVRTKRFELSGLEGTLAVKLSLSDPASACQFGTWSKDFKCRCRQGGLLLQTPLLFF